jgi:dihydroorotate dehydrogenase
MPYTRFIRPLLFRLPAETAHELGINGLGLMGATLLGRALLKRKINYPSLNIERFGLKFPHSLGLAAGFDKNGVAIRALESLGFGFVEVGTVTTLSQGGNERPRLFRLPADHALVNRLGFNNHGAEQLAVRLSLSPPRGIVGVNIGKSKVVELDRAVDDYLSSFSTVYPVADYVTVNVSSPNTPNLRELQHPTALAELLGALQERNRTLATRYGRTPIPLLVKVAPDLSDADLEALVEVAVNAGLSGIIATNTTISRKGLNTADDAVAAIGPGGLSGTPLNQRATGMVARIYRLAGEKLVIVGVGGIFTAQDAWEKITAGASLVQLYTGFIYEGPGVVARICAGLDQLLAEHGMKNIEEAIGIDANEKGL